MMFNREDWRRLRNPILGFGVVLALVGSLAFYAESFKRQQEQAVYAQKIQLNQARQKLMSSGQEREGIVRYLPLYQALLSVGFVGEEQRIEWIETIRKLHQQHKLFSIEYTIGPQENVAPSYLPSLGNFTLHRYKMKLELGMLHEMDLLVLLNGLRGQPTPFIVRSCEMVRPNRRKISAIALTPNLHAQCELEWYTLRDPQLRTP